MLSFQFDGSCLGSVLKKGTGTSRQSSFATLSALCQASFSKTAHFRNILHRLQAVMTLSYTCQVPPVCAWHLHINDLPAKPLLSREIFLFHFHIEDYGLELRWSTPEPRTLGRSARLLVLAFQALPDFSSVLKRGTGTSL